MSVSDVGAVVRPLNRLRLYEQQIVVGRIDVDPLKRLIRLRPNGYRPLLFKAASKLCASLWAVVMLRKRDCGSCIYQPTSARNDSVPSWNAQNTRLCPHHTTDHTQCKEIAHAGVGIRGQTHRCRPSRSVLTVVTVFTTSAHTYLVTHHSSKSSIVSAMARKFITLNVHLVQREGCGSRRRPVRLGRRPVWSCCPHTWASVVSAVGITQTAG